MAASTSVTYAYRGRGPVYTAVKSTPEKLLTMGNVGTFEYTLTEKTETLPNYNAAGGGVAEQDSEIQEVNFKLTTYTLDPANLAIGMRGLVSSVASAVVSAEAHTLYPGAFCYFANLPDLSGTLTISRTTTTARGNSTAYALGNIVKVGTHIYICKTAGTSAGSAPSFNTDGTDTTDGTVTWADTGLATATLSTDYVLGRSGILTTKTGAFRYAVNGEPVTILYTKNPADVIEALATSALEYTVVLDFLNAVDSGRPQAIKMHRVKFKPTSGLALIQESGYANLTFEGTALADTTIIAQGVSQYMTIKQPAAA